MKKKSSHPLFLLALLLAVSLCAVLLYLQKKAEEAPPEAGTSDHAQRPASSLELNGEEVPLKRNISALLVIGTDQQESEMPDDLDSYETHNTALADFMVVLVLDDDAKTITPLLLNRDTMCQVPWLGINGKVAGYVTQQLTYAHMYGDGGEESAQNCARAVSEFLYGAPLDHQIAFRMEAVPVLNDLVGGVTLTLSEDLPALGENYLAGEQITLRGEEALRFVRYRDTDLLESNASRMNRHDLYLKAFLPQARLAVQENRNFVLDAMEALNPYLCTDMSAEVLSDYVNKLCEYGLCDTLTYTGEYRRGEFAEFYPDSASVAEAVKAAFCLS